MNKTSVIMKRFFLDPTWRFRYLCKLGIFNRMPDEQFLKLKYKYLFGSELHLDPPVTFNEKLNWLKLHDRNPKYTTMVDKYAAKQYVGNIIGEQHIIPTLGVWDRFENIDFNALPDQFVLKCTHDSGGIVICKDKKKMDIDAARKKINKMLKRKFYYESREWPYKNVKPRIIAERYMVDESGIELKDYKFFCFDGVPKFMFVACDRENKNEETKFNFYDMDFNLMPFTNGHPNAPDGRITKPQAFDEMKKIAAKLSKDIKHVRVDLYDINGNIYFGELTFYHWSGMVPFDPPEWDVKLGQLLELPKQEN